MYIHNNKACSIITLHNILSGESHDTHFVSHDTHFNLNADFKLCAQTQMPQGLASIGLIMKSSQQNIALTGQREPANIQKGFITTYKQIEQKHYVKKKGKKRSISVSTSEIEIRRMSLTLDVPIQHTTPQHSKPGQSWSLFHSSFQGRKYMWRAGFQTSNPQGLRMIVALTHLRQGYLITRVCLQTTSATHAGARAEPSAPQCWTGLQQVTTTLCV